MNWYSRRCGPGLVLAALLVSVQLAMAEESAPPRDEILLKNGSRLIGRVTSARDGVVAIETDFADTLEIAMDKVESINTHEPVVVLMEDDSVHQDSSLSISEDLLALGGTQQTYPLEDLRALNPEPWELGQGYRWTGKFGMALQIERGNTDTDELDLDLETTWRSSRDRYRFSWASEQDKNNNDKTKDTWKAGGRYDYFLTDPNYVGLLLFAESDKFKDLDLRSMAGPYFGRQFYSEPIFSLSGELGVGWVDEQFDKAEDQDYPASFWNIDASSNILGGKSAVYFGQLGLWNLDDTSDVVLDTTLGLSFPLLWRLEAAAELLLEYDSGAVENVDELDQTYKFRVNYTW